MERTLSVLTLVGAAVVATPVIGLGIAVTGALWPVIPIAAGAGAAAHMMGNKKEEEDKQQKQK